MISLDCDSRELLAWYEAQMKLDDHAEQFASLVANQKVYWTNAGANFAGALRLDGLAAKARRDSPGDEVKIARLQELSREAHEEARRCAAQADGCRWELTRLRPDYDAGMAQVSHAEPQVWFNTEGSKFLVPADLDADEVALFAGAVVRLLQVESFESCTPMRDLAQRDALRAAQARLWLELQASLRDEAEARDDANRAERSSSASEERVEEAILDYAKATELRAMRCAALVRTELELCRLLEKSLREIAAMRPDADDE